MATYFALSLDPTTHDLHLSGSSLVTVEDAAAVAQRVKQHLLSWRGEWFLDTSAGVPWLQHVYVQPFDQAIAEAVIKAAIVAVPGVAEILSFSAEFDRGSRGLRAYEISILTDFDEVVSING